MNRPNDDQKATSGPDDMTQPGRSQQRPYGAGNMPTPKGDRTQPGRSQPTYGPGNPPSTPKKEDFKAKDTAGKPAAQPDKLHAAKGNDEVMGQPQDRKSS